MKTEKQKLEEIDKMLFVLCRDMKTDKKGKIRYDDFHDAVTDVRIKIAKL